MTVLEAIQRSTEFLVKKGVETPRLQVELLLAHVLKLARMKLYLNFERQLTSEEADILRQFVIRRGNREPLQHITGSTSFCGYEIMVNRDVLVPRPETELLAERAWTFLSSPTVSAPSALDLCTGSGCLAVALAAHCPNATIVATDLSRAALTCAKENAAKNNVDNRIEFLEGDAFAPLRQGIVFDLIVSNPPYIPTGEIETLDPEVRDFDPRLALDGGADGLVLYHRIAREAKPFLKPGGRLMLEFGDGQAPALREIFSGQNWIVEMVERDYSQRDRILIAHL